MPSWGGDGQGKGAKIQLLRCISMTGSPDVTRCMRMVFGHGARRIWPRLPGNKANRRAEDNTPSLLRTSAQNQRLSVGFGRKILSGEAAEANIETGERRCQSCPPVRLLGF